MSQSRSLRPRRGTLDPDYRRRSTTPEPDPDLLAAHLLWAPAAVRTALLATAADSSPPSSPATSHDDDDDDDDSDGRCVLPSEPLASSPSSSPSSLSASSDDDDGLPIPFRMYPIPEEDEDVIVPLPPLPRAAAASDAFPRGRLFFVSRGRVAGVPRPTSVPGTYTVGTPRALQPLVFEPGTTLYVNLVLDLVLPDRMGLVVRSLANADGMQYPFVLDTSFIEAQAVHEHGIVVTNVSEQTQTLGPNQTIAEIVFVEHGLDVGWLWRNDPESPPPGR